MKIRDGCGLQTKKVENDFVAGEYFILHKYTEVLISNQMINRGIEIMLDVKFKEKETFH